MRLEPLEYIVNKHMGEETITITKKALEKWRDSYREVSANEPSGSIMAAIYIVKADVLSELLEYFDEEE